MSRPGGIEVRLHIFWPLLALLVLLVVSKSTDLSIASSLTKPTVAMWAFSILFTSVTIHELARAAIATRLGGRVNSFVLAPIGGLSRLHLPVDPPAHLVTALVGPVTYLMMLIVAGCVVAITGDRDKLLTLLNPCSPGIAMIGAGSIANMVQMVAQLTVWINWCLLLLSLLPIDPCGGAELLRGVLWPMVGRSTAASVTARIALGLAVVTSVVAMWMPSDVSAASLVPAWFPFACISILLFYGGYRHANTVRYDVGISIDEFDSDDEEWLLNDWEEDDREVVLVEHLQDKQQEALDRKRREREAVEDEQVDAILLRLQETSFEELSEEDRATLKRASRRYRQRREDSPEDKPL